MGNERLCQRGDSVRVKSGCYEGRSGVVTHVRTPEDTLYEGAPKNAPVIPWALDEPYAVVETRLVADVDGSVRKEEIAVPVRRLQPL